MASVTITRGTTLPNSSAKSDFHNLVDTATASVSNIVNADVDSAAAIASSKLDLSAITQALVMSNKILKLVKGADVASVAGAITLGDDGNYFDITGTNAITSITAKTAGTVVYLQFDSTASLVDGSNLKLAGNFQGAAESQITLISDGTNWFELSRNNHTIPTAATQSDQETATSTTTYVSPGRQQFHPSACKAWGRFDGTGTPAYAASYNMDASITDNGTGDWTVSFATDFSGASAYALVGMTRRAAGTASGVLNFDASVAPAAGTCRILSLDGGSTLVDKDIVTFVAFGDQ